MYLYMDKIIGPGDLRQTSKVDDENTEGEGGFPLWNFSNAFRIY
jgi:hypothetical protein